MLLKIHDFAEFSGISTRALHLYDRIELFCPDKTDESNGYRYYDTDQMMELNTILSFKKLGLPLKDIKEIKLSGYAKDMIVLKLSERNSIDFMSGFINNDFGASMFYAPPRDNESKEAVRTFIGSVGGTLQLSDNWVMKPRLSYRANKDDYIFIRQKPDAFHNIHKTGVIDAELNNTLLTRYGVIGAGFELRTERINSNNLGKHNRTNVVCRI